MQTKLILMALTTVFACAAAPIQFGFLIDSTQYVHTVASPKPKEYRLSVGGSVVIDPSNHRWMIRFPSLGNAEEVHLCDGTNVVKYTVVLHQDATLLQQYPGAIAASLPKDGGPIAMVVTPGLHPADHYLVNLAWMAWCSGPFLKIPGRTIPTAVHPTRVDLAAYGFSDQTETFADSFGLPKRLEQFASHERLKTSPLSPTIGREIANPARMEAAFARNILIRDGSIHSRYVAEDSKVVEGVALATQFHFVSFQSRQDDQEVPIVVAQGRIVGEVETTAFGLPEAIRSHRSFGVVDYRFRHERKAVDSIQYGQPDFVVREASDPKLMELYDARLSKAALDPVLQVRLRIYGMVGLGLVLPVIAAAFWRIKRRQNRTTS